MDDWKLPWEGGCRCGEVRIRVTKPPILTGACHCTGCQKMTASAFSLTVTVPADGFEVTKGEPVLGGLRGPVSHHHHCPQCLTWIFTRAEASTGSSTCAPRRSTIIAGSSPSSSCGPTRSCPGPRPAPATATGRRPKWRPSYRKADGRPSSSSRRRSWCLPEAASPVRISADRGPSSSGCSASAS